MDRIVEIIKEEIRKYAGKGANVMSYPLLDDVNRTYGIISVDYPTREEIATVLLMIRISDDKIIIEEDMTDTKLLDTLLQAGIPRDKIILAYAGEPVPEEA